MPSTKPRSTSANQALITGLCTDEGPTSGSIVAKWDPIPSATYEIKLFAEHDLKGVVAQHLSPRCGHVVFGLAPGVHYWVVVRARIGPCPGPWTTPAAACAKV